MRKRITKRMLADAKRTVTEYRSSGLAGRRYKGDDADAWALAIINTLATMPVCNDASKSGKREHIANGGAFIGEEWYSIHPAMSTTTRPDQGFESRMLTNVVLANETVGWGWYNDPDEHGFVIVRTA